MSNGLNLKVFGQEYDNIKGIRVPGFGEDAPTYNFIVPTGVITVTNNSGNESVDITQYAEAIINVQPESLQYQTRVVTPTFSQQSIVANDGSDALREVIVEAIHVGSMGAPVVVTSTVTNNDYTNMIITPTVRNEAGYIVGGTVTGSSITVSASDIVRGTKPINLSGNYDVTNYKTVNVNVNTKVQSKTATYTPTTSPQSYHIIHDSDYIGLQSVDVNIEAIPSEYIIPSGIKNIDANGNYNIAAYETVSVSVAGGTTVTLQDKTITPSQQSIVVTCDNGYTGLGTVTVMAIPNQYIIPTGIITISSNGTYDVTNAASVEINVAGGGTTPNLQPPQTITPSESIITVTPNSGYNGLSSVTIAAITPTYIGSSVTRNSSSNITVSGATVCVPAGYYDSDTTKTINSGSVSVVASVNSSTGRVTAKATMCAGYFNTQTNYGYLDLNTQSGTTITPSSNTQIAVSAGKYTTGNVYIAAIPSQYIVPTGTITITENTTLNISSYALVHVNVTNSVEDYQDGDILLYGESPSSIVGVAKVGNAYVGIEE